MQLTGYFLIKVIKKYFCDSHCESPCRVVNYLNIKFEELNACGSTIEMINANGNIEIEVTETSGEIYQSFTLKAKRKRLRRLKEIAAFNVAKHIYSEDDLDFLEMPKTLKPLVKTFIITYSGNYIINMNSD